MLNAVLFKPPQYAIDIGSASDIYSIFRQFIHRSEIACAPVSVGEIKMIAPSVQKSLTRFGVAILFRTHGDKGQHAT